MINPFLEVNWHPQRLEKNKFALSLIIGFPLVALFLGCLGRLVMGTWNAELWSWVAGGGVLAGVILWLAPVPLARPFYCLWYGVACSIGFVVGNVLFSVFFYFFLTPMGVILRTIKPSFFQKQADPSASTYWRDPDSVADLSRYYRQF